MMLTSSQTIRLNLLKGVRDGTITSHIELRTPVGEKLIRCEGPNNPKPTAAGQWHLEQLERDAAATNGGSDE